MRSNVQGQVLALHKLTLPLCESRPIVGQSVAVRCLDVAHWTDAADGGEFIHIDGRVQARWHGQMFNIHKGKQILFSQTADNKFKRFTQKKEKKCKIKINFYERLLWTPSPS